MHCFNDNAKEYAIRVLKFSSNFSITVNLGI